MVDVKVKGGVLVHTDEDLEKDTYIHGNFIYVIANYQKI